MAVVDGLKVLHPERLLVCLSHLFESARASLALTDY
jgi:hypothetical protein